MLGGRSRNSKDMGYICIFLALSLLHWSGRPEEFHLQSPTDPYVNLSIHTAPTSLALGTSRPQADAGSRTAPPSLLVGQDFLSLYPFTGNRCPPPKRVLIRVLKLSPFGVKHLKNGLSIIRDRNSLIFG
jgi:hypothetical protein